ncbi:hypothetical protein A1Q1_02934 [Trichosporon asahii var. asahii CBS 2479]|uniref:Cytochrome b-c1 complex subunit 8 n=1 Tax=Trichosporon asahii var. asahii (strain ATCC 90039 / CBS 2479 / JCM 2466 / KCTC 7840 / NBRC 103889/ NCYC 2677 / UAMH 7654) TaxID=1186058 RepID=J5QLX5_TRIAS|nr:hypothetical protein A1Q1_02934 [Trichosporon asahii var. asahii CBS 2479]EJT48018.1 hypothetical protein A1Q1_02934 [Trichosporon asahii var. asahii CBS 2479]
MRPSTVVQGGMPGGAYTPNEGNVLTVQARPGVADGLERESPTKLIGTECVGVGARLTGQIGWWGAMGGPKQKGIYTYSISNNQQAAMRGAIPGYIFWGFRRIAAQVPYFALPFAAGYATYVWGKNKYAWYNSKEGHHIMHEAEAAAGGH